MGAYTVTEDKYIDWPESPPPVHIPDGVLVGGFLVIGWSIIGGLLYLAHGVLW